MPSILPKIYLWSCLSLVALAAPAPMIAQVIALDIGQPKDERRNSWLPYAFATESLGTAIGVGAFSAGQLQPQASLGATIFVTSNDSALFFGSLNHLRLGDSRTFVDSSLLVDHFTDQRFYAGLNLDPDEPRAGSNDSDPSDFVTGISNEVTAQLTLKYRLPTGGIREDPVAIYRLHEGLLESGPLGGDSWNPKQSGQSTLAAKYFYTYRDLSQFAFNKIGTLPIEEQLFAKTNGLEIWFEVENTDFPRNPSKGSRQLLKITRDFGWLDSRESWTNLEADFSKYFDLGRSAWFRQRALALNFWTSSSPSWKVSANTSSISHRPPPNYGSSLGGYDRMRAYPSGRFHDKSAVYYSAELRMIPQTQPLRSWPLLEYFEIDWWEIVPFVEVGRVGDRYNSDLFSQDLKVDVGLGLRLMSFRAVVRVDWAISEEGSSVWAMVSQPFSRQGD